MRIATLLALVSIISLYGCIGQGHYASVPSDLKIVAYTDCSLSFDEWDERITIDSAGNGVYEYHVYREKTDLEWIIDRLFGSDVEKKTFRLSEEELLSLLSSIETSGFYELKGERSEHICIYDFCSVIEITKNGSTKKFIDDGCDTEQFAGARKAIWDVARNRTNSSG